MGILGPWFCFETTDNVKEIYHKEKIKLDNMLERNDIDACNMKKQKDYVNSIKHELNKRNGQS